MSFINDAVSFMGDPGGWGNSLLGSVSKSLGLDNNAQVDSAIASLDDIRALAERTGQTNRNLYDTYMQRMQGMYGDNASKYSDAVSRLAEAIDNRGDFEFSGNVDDYLDPAREQRVSAAMSAINNSAASGGNRFSSNYLDKVAAKQQSLASEEWRNAYDRMMRERSQQLQEWQSGQQKINNLGTIANIYGQDRNQLSDAIGNYYSTVANQNNADLETMSDVMQNKANVNMGRSTGIGSLLKGGGNLVGSLFA